MLYQHIVGELRTIISEGKFTQSKDTDPLENQDMFH